MLGSFSFHVEDGEFQKALSSHFTKRCVSVARKPEGVAVRDTKDASKNTLFFTNEEWSAFLDGAKKGEFDLAR